MDSVESKINNLKVKITEAFDNTMYPGDSKILHPQCQDDSEISAFYGLKDWKSVPDRVLEFNEAALSFFSPEAYQFYIPRFLIYILDNYNSEEIIVDNTIYSLYPIYDDLRDFTLSKFRDLTYRQRSVIASFLRLLIEDLKEFFDEKDLASALEFWSSM